MKKALIACVGLAFLIPISVANAIPQLPCVRGEASSSSGYILACPQQDGPSLASQGLTVSIRLLDGAGNPISGFAKKFLWLAEDGVSTCGVWTGIMNADAATDSDGRTTFSGIPRAGGCSDGPLYVIVQINGDDYLLSSTPGLPADCLSGVLTLPITIRSPDMNGDGTVSLSDYSRFVAAYQGSYDECADFNGDGSVSLPDLSMFTVHYQNGGHHCP